MSFEQPSVETTERRQAMGEQAVVLHGFALPYVDEIVSILDELQEASAFRHMTTPGGFTMSMAVTNCGDFGWTSDRKGYRYTSNDPQTGSPWPPMPAAFTRLAVAAALEAGFADFEPDACLINRYVPGARLTLHQDKNERDFNQPIVTVSLGMSAVFQFGGQERGDKVERYPLSHGDVTVWGGVDRLRYHGVNPLKDIPHPLFGSQRISLTFRKAA
jgi:alkylated DNA repair protein (DNA oxidative demethylase)